jgi:hypothetical protein
MLCDPRTDFTGGAFQTLEATDELLTHQFGLGDVMCFVSHKYHCVSPVESGSRSVMIVEFWAGPAKTCAHRCLCGDHARPCQYDLSGYLRETMLEGAAFMAINAKRPARAIARRPASHTVCRSAWPGQSAGMSDSESDDMDEATASAMAGFVEDLL